MPKSTSRRILVSKLKRFGFSGPFPGGKHYIMTINGLRLVIPNPYKGDISKGLVARIIREAGISKEE